LRKGKQNITKPCTIGESDRGHLKKGLNGGKPNKVEEGSTFQISKEGKPFLATREEGKNACKNI